MTLFLHGFTGAPSSASGLFEALGNPPGWEAPWLFGHGDTPDLTRSASFEEEARQLLAQTTSRVCIGYSLGSRLALAMGVLAPERFDRLVLIGVHPGLETVAERESRASEDELRACALESSGLIAFVDAWQALPLFDEEILPESARTARRSIRLAHTADGLAAALRVLGLGQMPFYKERLMTLPPTHLVVGERDAKFQKLATDMATRSHAEVHIAPNAGHDALIWAPELVARLAA
ncbi:MAG: 2-succinyl-6-hydroxy-2,4-cyclohexadiene-1-carboxylate synthase [Polyangiales bacterium]